MIPKKRKLKACTTAFGVVYYSSVKTKYARVMELADMQDLGSCAERCGGSSPFSRTTICPKTLAQQGFSSCVKQVIRSKKTLVSDSSGFRSKILEKSKETPLFVLFTFFKFLKCCFCLFTQELTAEKITE